MTTTTGTAWRLLTLATWCLGLKGWRSMARELETCEATLQPFGYDAEFFDLSCRRHGELERFEVSDTRERVVPLADIVASWNRHLSSRPANIEPT